MLVYAHVGIGYGVLARGGSSELLPDPRAGRLLPAGLRRPNLGRSRSWRLRGGVQRRLHSSGPTEELARHFYFG